MVVVTRKAHEAKQADSEIRDTGPYTSRGTSKGSLIEEAGRIFEALGSGQSIDDVRDRVLNGTLLGQRSSVNRQRIWDSVRYRYVLTQAPWLVRLASDSCRAGAHSPEFVTLLYLLYAVRDRLAFDFVAEVLFAKGTLSQQVVSRNDVLDFLQQSLLHETQIERWSESTRTKLAGSILTALRDFGLLAGHQKKIVTKPVVPQSTVEAALRLLTEEGQRGREILQSRTWRLFLWNEAEVAAALAKLAQAGKIRFEKVGSTVVLDTPVEWEATP